ncbi:UvrD-helicase domain-containing protein [Pseudomonas sp. UBA1879]|uniref:UvrD-helicase domain-containing protein n=1 Tax=Pseudomonas sp. UBA1879 TaxID=1947305 RepID=UPI0025F2E374|nr:UvrD-helicase domain-containing protein [Pseudomonas sp. UBA1879]
MNPFDRARIQANNTRSTLVAASGLLHPTSEELLAGVEEALGLMVEPVSPGYYALGGGDAYIQRGYSTILIRNDVSAQDRAYLLAHELGHWYLDPSLAPPGSTPTPARVSDLAGSAGQGTAVLEGYGAWERQELQANVFARELLLPRSFARALWHNGWRSRAIANHFCLPLELVRQQLADALLLPDVPALPLAPAHPPSDAQRLAAQAPERYVNVVAGPGTGKTTTLVHRVAHLIGSGVPASRILVMTFTNRAAQELVERLTAGSVPNAAQIWAGTFHSFGLEILRKHHYLFNLTPQIKIADLLQQVRLLAGELPNLRLNYFFRLRNPYDWLPDVLKIIHRLKEELIFPDQYAAIVQALPAVEEDVARERSDIVTLYRAYEAVLRRDGWVDQPDLLVRPTLMARDDRPSLAPYLEQFDHVLVDEYQDVNHVMVEFVKRIGPSQRNLWVVGDIRQAIHHWRGASIQSLLKFDEAYSTRRDGASLQRYTLDINRRSSPEILRLVQKAGTTHVLQPIQPLDQVFPSQAANGLLPTLVPTSSKPEQHRMVAAQVEQARSAGYRYGSQGVISATNVQVDELAQALEQAGIPVLHVGDLSQRVEVKEFMCLMQLLARRSPSALLGLQGQPDFTLPIADINLLMELSKQGFEHQRGRWLRTSVPIPGLSPRGQQVVGALRSLLQGNSRSSRPWAFVCDLLFEQGYGMGSLSDHSVAAQIRRLAVWQFLYGVRNTDGVGSQATLSKYLIREDFKRYIGQRSAERVLPPEAAAIDAVRVMTVHGSKGLEFDVVHLANVELSRYGAEPPAWSYERQGLLLPPEALNSTPQMRSEGEAIERNNLLYVGLSRAKSRLQVYCGVDDSTVPLPLRDPAVIAQYAGARVPAISVPAPRHRPLVTPASISYAALDGFMTCPLQYYYGHELNFPAEQEMDVSIRARKSVLVGLEYFYRDGMASDQAFLRAWQEKSLPTYEEDRTLSEDAWDAFGRGTALLPSVVQYVPESTSSVNGQVITMPWMLRDAEGGLIWLRTGMSLDQVAKNVRPIMETLGGSGCQRMALHSLSSGRTESCIPSARASNTSLYKAVSALRASDRTARKGKHCNRCAYTTICAQRPA